MTRARARRMRTYAFGGALYTWLTGGQRAGLFHQRTRVRRRRRRLYR